MGADEGLAPPNPPPTPKPLAAGGAAAPKPPLVAAGFPKPPPPKLPLEPNEGLGAAPAPAPAPAPDSAADSFAAEVSGLEPNAVGVDEEALEPPGTPKLVELDVRASAPKPVVAEVLGPAPAAADDAPPPPMPPEAPPPGAAGRPAPKAGAPEPNPADAPGFGAFHPAPPDAPKEKPGAGPDDDDDDDDKTGGAVEAAAPPKAGLDAPAPAVPNANEGPVLLVSFTPEKAPVPGAGAAAPFPAPAPESGAPSAPSRRTARTILRPATGAELAGGASPSSDGRSASPLSTVSLVSVSPRRFPTPSICRRRQGGGEKSRWRERRGVRRRTERAQQGCASMYLGNAGCNSRHRPHVIVREREAVARRHARGSKASSQSL